MRNFFILALLPACAHRQAVTHTKLDYDKDGCTDMEVVKVNLGALPDGTSTVAVEMGANDQRRFSEQFRPVEGTTCKSLFTADWGPNMEWDSMTITVRGIGWDTRFTGEMTLDPSSPHGEYCLTDDAWGKLDGGLTLEVKVTKYNQDTVTPYGTPYQAFSIFTLPNFPPDFYDGSVTLNFNELLGVRSTGEHGKPLVMPVASIPVDFTFTAQASPGTWKEVDPTWHFSWEKPECLAKTAAETKRKKQ